MLPQPKEVEHFSVEPKSLQQAPSQLVEMSRAELGLYVQQGRPTGLLLRSVAALKGMTSASVALASGIPEALVKSIFSDCASVSLKKGAIKRVANVLGIDLSVMRFAAGQVHIFRTACTTDAARSNAFRHAVRAVGLLARGARVAELKVGTGIRSFRWRGKLHVMQTEHFRALFVGSTGKKFDLSYVPSAQWICEDRGSSIVPIVSRELADGLVARDLTESEFDEIFQASSVLTWDAIRIASRINGVSKGDLMRFIESRAAESDLYDDAAEIRAINDVRPTLRLIENELPGFGRI